MYFFPEIYSSIRQIAKILSAWCSRDPPNKMAFGDGTAWHNYFFLPSPRCLVILSIRLPFFWVSDVLTHDCLSIPLNYSLIHHQARSDHIQHIPCSSIHKPRVVYWRRYPKTTPSNVYLANKKRLPDGAWLLLMGDRSDISRKVQILGTKILSNQRLWILCQVNIHPTHKPSCRICEHCTLHKPRAFPGCRTPCQRCKLRRHYRIGAPNPHLQRNFKQMEIKYQIKSIKSMEIPVFFEVPNYWYFSKAG